MPNDTPKPKMREPLGDSYVGPNGDTEESLRKKNEGLRLLTNALRRRKQLQELLKKLESQSPETRNSLPESPDV